MNVVKDIQLSKNFRLGEFKCRHCTDVLLPNIEFVNKLQEIRDLLNKPIRVAGYRCPIYNQQLVNNPNVSASPNSLHLQGIAADLTSVGVTPEELCYIARLVGCGVAFGGLGIYDGHIHVDMRDNVTFFDSRVRNKDKKINPF